MQGVSQGQGVWERRSAETEYASCLALNFMWCQKVSSLHSRGGGGGGGTVEGPPNFKGKGKEGLAMRATLKSKYQRCTRAAYTWAGQNFMS